ncbi:hypothetical protein AN958_02268 [Leucoagaricus sp. SymC.cos]|nr:hypothetical protein AN958_02268 [Leucoagaricus sp. SymC.cos]
MSIRSFSKSEHTKVSGFDYHLRLYQDGDKEHIHSVYLDAMIWHSHAPMKTFIKLVATSTIAKTLYRIAIFGAFLWCFYPTLGQYISLAAGGAALLQLGLAIWMIVKHTKQNSREGLADIREHYQLVPTNEDEGKGDVALRASGPRAFWVVEAIHKVTGNKEVAGFGGLDIVKKGDKTDVELRRIAVSGRHTRQGVAAMIVKAAITQAKAHDLPSIYLSTSSLQMPAVHLYKKFGWVEEKRRDLRALGVKAHAIFMRLHLKDRERVMS